MPPGASSFLELNQKLGFFIYDTYFKYVQWRFEIDIWHVTIGYPLGVAMTHYAKNNKVKYKPLNLKKSTFYNLEDRLLLFFTGYSRSAGKILKNQDDRSSN